MMTATSSPLLFAMPICLEALFRLACKSWVRVCKVLRSLSKAANMTALNVNPRLLSVATTAFKSVLNACISNIVFLIRDCDIYFLRKPKAKLNGF